MHKNINARGRPINPILYIRDSKGVVYTNVYGSTAGRKTRSYMLDCLNNLVQDGKPVDIIYSSVDEGNELVSIETEDKVFEFCAGLINPKKVKAKVSKQVKIRGVAYSRF